MEKGKGERGGQNLHKRGGKIGKKGEKENVGGKMGTTQMAN